MKKFTTTFLLTLLSISPVTAQTKPDVAVLGADPNNLSDPRSKLESTGLFNNVDAINISSTTPSLSNLQQYDAVLVYYSDFPADRNALGDVLADYVDRGGPMQGRSMVPLLTGASDTIRQPGDYMGWELFGKRAIRQGDWTIIYLPQHEVRDGVIPVVTTDTWQLYNLADDPAEMHDLSATHPERLADMIALWDDYVERVNVILPDQTSGY